MAKITASDLPDRLDENGEGVWETVAEESPTVVLFNTVGDQLVGFYVGEDHIAPENGEEFDRYVFNSSTGPVAVNKSYKLEEAMQKVQPGDFCRITYVKEIPTKRGLNPLKDFRVEVKR